jgi:hypothetical protein
MVERSAPAAKNAIKVFHTDKRHDALLTFRGINTYSGGDTVLRKSAKRQI